MKVAILILFMALQSMALPPLPPGYTPPATRFSSPNAPVLSKPMLKASLVPAAFVPAGDMAISSLYPDPEFGDFYIVSGLQLANHLTEFQAQDMAGGAWQTIGTWSAYPVDQRVGVSIQAGLPSRWVRSKNTTAPSSLTSVRAEGTDTGKTLTVGGKQFRLILLSPRNAQFRMYRLTP